jgi:DNA-binding NarL/FixJ family response regulator
MLLDRTPVLRVPAAMTDNQYFSILLADEFALVREGIARVCERLEGFKVATQCSDGVSALETIQARTPDLAIIDLQIPKLFSLELIRKVKENNLPTRFIVLAQRGDRKTALEALRAGANGFVLKSSSALQLMDALKSVAGGSVYVSSELQFEKVFFGARKSQLTDPLETLSSREYQVFRLLVDGIRAKEIAARLELSPKTVDTYRASLMRKLDIHDVAGLVKFAIQRELVAV